MFTRDVSGAISGEGSIAVLGASQCVLSPLIRALDRLLPKDVLPFLLPNTFISPKMADKRQIFHKFLGPEIALGLGIGEVSG